MRRIPPSPLSSLLNCVVMCSFISSLSPHRFESRCRLGSGKTLAFHEILEGLMVSDVLKGLLRGQPCRPDDVRPRRSIELRTVGQLRLSGLQSLGIGPIGLAEATVPEVGIAGVDVLCPVLFQPPPEPVG